MRKIVFCLVCGFLLLLSACGGEANSASTGKDENDFDVVGEESTTTMTDITSDNIAEKLQEFGMTKEEAATGREILLSCGVESIDMCEPTDPNASVDGLVSFRGELDDDRTFWFTVENREIFYVSLNGTDLYDTAQGGYLMSMADVHIPESEVSP